VADRKSLNYRAAFLDGDSERTTHSGHRRKKLAVNRRAIIAAAIVLTAVGAGGYAVSKRLQAAKAISALTQYKIAKVETGEVKKTVSSTGTLQPWNIVDIKARAGGELTLLRKDIGDEVKKGEVLARIDPLDVQLSLNTARADEQSAVARKEQSAKTYDLQVKQSQIAIRDAEANLRISEANVAAAKARLNTLKTQSSVQPTLTSTAIANAQASYEQAVKQVEQAKVTNSQQRAAAKAAYDQAIANQKNAKQSVERQQNLVTKGFVAQQTLDTAIANLAVIDAQVDSARIKLDTIDAELSASLAAAEARVAQTKAALDTAKANSVEIKNRQNAVKEQEVAVRQSEEQLRRTRIALDQARTNLANNAIRGYDVQAANATIARAQASRINAETTLQRTEVTAPSDGVVLQKYVEQGTIIASALSIAATGTNILQIGDVSRMYVDVTVDETDIANVDVGQVVDVAIEAYPGVPFEGKVTRIDPRAQVLQNVTSIHVRVEVDNSTPTFRLLKPGMNATCEFVIDKKEDVVRVPNEAIHEDDEGKYVEVAIGGKPAPADPQSGMPADPDMKVEVQKKQVRLTSEQIGVEGNEYTEIVSGLKADDPIITQTIEPAPPSAAQGSPFSTGFGRGGGGGGRGGGRPGGGGR
jgi:HlyD family secretion protein